MNEKVFYEVLNNAVNASCYCGGCGPSDPAACPACMVWHRVKGSEYLSAPPASEIERLREIEKAALRYTSVVETSGETDGDYNDAWFGLVAALSAPQGEERREHEWTDEAGDQWKVAWFTEEHGTQGWASFYLMQHGWYSTGFSPEAAEIARLAGLQAPEEGG